MKRLLFTLISFALLASCSTDNLGDNAPVLVTSKISVEVTPEPTRTYTDGSQIFWAESGEQLNIIYYADDNSSSRRQTSTHTDYTLTDNRILFTADFTATDGATSYTLGAFYPYAYKYSTSSINLTVPQEQTPAENSYDPATDILVSTNPVTVQGTPDKVNFTFSRLVAFAKMTLVGIPAGEKIESVVFSSPAKPAGAVEFKVHEQGTLENAKWYNNYEDITINLGGRVATGEDVVWFTTVPTDLSDSEFTVTVTTDQSVYTKSVDLTGKTLNFERANIAQFRVKELVKMEKPVVYVKLNNPDELQAGYKVLISHNSSSSGSAEFMSTTPDDDYTGRYDRTAGVEYEDNQIFANDLESNTLVFVLENSSVSGEYLMKSQIGYLVGTYTDSYAISFTNNKSEASRWSFNKTSYSGWNIRNENGCTLNYSTSSYSFRVSSSYSSIYPFYCVAELEQDDDQESTTPLATPVVTATAAANSVTVEWGAVEGAKDYTVTCGTATQTVTTTSVTFTELDYATEYTVTVVANPADASVNSASEAGTATVTTEAAPSQGGDTQSVTLSFPDNFPEGASSGDSVDTIYEGDVIISSTGSWRTDKTDGRDCIYIGRTTSNELRIEAQNGKVITKVTLTAPVGYLVDLNCKEYDSFTTTTFSSTTEATWSGECKSRLVYTAAGSSHSNIASITVEYK